MIKRTGKLFLHDVFLAMPLLISGFASTPVFCQQLNQSAILPTLGSEALAFSKRGSELTKQNHFAEVIRAFNEAARLSPNDANCYINRGRCYEKLQQYQKAVEDYNKAIDIRPGDDWSYVFRAGAFYKLQQYQKAVDDYSKSISLEPSEASTYCTRGDVYKKLKQYPKAIADYSKSISLKPNEAEGYQLRGDVYCELKQYQKAIADLNKAISLDPNDAASYSSRAEVYRQAKNVDNEIKDRNKSILLNPKNYGEYVHRGSAYFGLQQFQRALQDVDKVICSPEQSAVILTGAYYLRAGCFFALGQYQKAIDDCNKEIALDSQLPAGYSSLKADSVELRNSALLELPSLAKQQHSISDTEETCEQRILARKKSLGTSTMAVVEDLESLAKIQQANGKIDKARQTWTEALAIRSKHPDQKQTFIYCEDAPNCEHHYKNDVYFQRIKGNDVTIVAQHRLLPGIPYGEGSDRCLPEHDWGCLFSLWQLSPGTPLQTRVLPLH